MEKNKKNIWHIAWVVGIYATLVVLLYMVVLYKVKWESLDLNKYLYFYDCSNYLCSTENSVDKYYSKVLCKDNLCPLILQKNGNLLSLKSNNEAYVYDYINGKIINNTYTDYRFTDNNYLIVTDNNNLQGIIDYDGDVKVDFNYKSITNYLGGYVVFYEEGRYGIDNDNEEIHTGAKYKDVALINKQMFAYKDDDDSYYIASFDSMLPMSSTMYDYVTSIDGLIFVIKNKQINILDKNLASKIVMKIDTYYSYKSMNEIKTLNLYSENNLIHFSVFMGNDTYKNYIYDTRNDKLYTE